MSCTECEFFIAKDNITRIVVCENMNTTLQATGRPKTEGEGCTTCCFDNAYQGL